MIHTFLPWVHLVLLVIAYLLQLLPFLSLHSLRTWQFLALCSKKWWNEENPTETRICDLCLVIKVLVIYLYLSSSVFEGISLDSSIFSCSPSSGLSESPRFLSLFSRIIFIWSLKNCSWKSILGKELLWSVKIDEGECRDYSVKIKMM